MKYSSLALLSIIFSCLVIVSACNDDSLLPELECGTMGLTMDDTSYDVDTCTGLTIQRGCDIVVEFLEVCGDNDEACKRLSFSFQILNPDEQNYKIVLPELLGSEQRTISGFFSVWNDSIEPDTFWIHEGNLTVTKVREEDGAISGSLRFEVEAQLPGEITATTHVINATFENVVFVLN